MLLTNAMFADTFNNNSGSAVRNYAYFNTTVKSI